MGYLVPGRDALRVRQNGQSSWDVAAAASPPPRPRYTQSIHSNTQSISSNTQNISSNTQSISSNTQSISSNTQKYNFKYKKVYVQTPRGIEVQL